MTVGVALNASDAPNQVDATAQLVQEAAEFGVTSAWFGQTFGADSPQLAAIVGREVPGLQVGTSAIPVFGRHPLLVSSQAQTAQAATHGRYHLGLALGKETADGDGLRPAFRTTHRPTARIPHRPTAVDNRALALDPPAADGTVVLDFNRAANLPCAYTDLATCPLPPAENRLPVAIEADQKIPRERGGC
jgi:uncharacterized protein DUF1684/luciferase-like monooxygenase